MPDMIFTGTQVNYYFVCQRKLWYFSHYITMEHGSDMVAFGSAIHQFSYLRKTTKEIEIDGKIKIDFFDKSGVIHEVKKSRKIEDAHIWQLKYYLYYLKTFKGVAGLTGMLDYPKLHKREEVSLTPADEKFIENLLGGIRDIMKSETPPKATKKQRCKPCAYYDLCWIGEE